MGYWIADKMFLDLVGVFFPVSLSVCMRTQEEVIMGFLMASARGAELLFGRTVYVVAGL